MAYIVNETFTTGAVPADWHPASDGDFNYTAAPLEGAKSLRMATGTQALYIHGSELAGEHWIHFMLRLEDLPASGFHGFFHITDSSLSAKMFAIVVLDTGEVQVGDASGTNTITLADPIAADTTYHVWGRFKKGTGANAEKEIWINTSDDRAGSPAGWHGVDTTGTTTGGLQMLAFTLAGAPEPFIVDVVQWSDTDVFAGGTIIRYVNTASAGGDGTTNALSGANAAFASLRAALTSMPMALTNPVLILCEGVAADTLSCSQAQWFFETENTKYITVLGNNWSGKYDTTKYRIETTDEKAIYNNIAGHVRLENIQVQITITTSAALNYDAFRLATANNLNGPVDHRYKNCIAKFVIQGGATDNGFGFIDSDPTSGGTCVRINCIAYGGHAGFNSAWAAGVKNYNCTSYGNEFNYLDPQTCVNCISANPTSGPGFGFYNTGSTGHAFNASDDATAVGMGPRTNQTFSFVNAAAGDFHLLSTDQGAKGFGLTDPASGLYDDDIDGQPRVGDWDIGADESPDPARIIFEKAS